MDCTHPPLHQFNPLTRFDDRARDYAAYRPSYPAAAIDAILSGMGDARNLSAADIGAGTGIASRLLADRGVRVRAIEPNAAMRAVAAPHAGVTFLEATAEKTGLPDASIDVATSFQAFHWFEPEAALREFHRILRPAGRLALVWNERDSRDPFTAEYGELILAVCGDHPSLKRSGMELSAHRVEASGLFRAGRSFETPNSRRSSCDALLGASLSGSYVPREGPGYEQLMDGLRRLHEKYRGADGCVQMIYKTEVMLAERA